MKRLTMSLDDEQADAFEALVRARGYENRSEAFRDLLRQDLGNVRLRDRPDEPCVATLSYVYNHHQRQLAMRLMDLQHEHHELTIPRRTLISTTTIASRRSSCAVAPRRFGSSRSPSSRSPA